jgi:chromate transporter
VTAVVLGAILDLTFFLGKGVLFPNGTLSIQGLDWVAMIWVVVSLVLLKFKLNEMHLVFLSVAFGAGTHLLHIAL